MNNDNDYVEGLTGEEIIEDALDQVAAKLRRDCNLRDTDAYQGGYDGWVEVHLNLRGIDLAKVDTKIIVSKPAEAGAIPGEGEQKSVDLRVEIPLEPRLNVVRERSGQEIPTLAKDEEGRPVIKKRRYARGAADAATREPL